MMGLHFEHLYVLFLLLMIPALYLLYTKYNSEKKDSALKFSSLKIIKRSITGRNFTRRHLPFVLLVGTLGLIVVGFASWALK